MPCRQAWLDDTHGTMRFQFWKRHCANAYFRKQQQQRKAETAPSSSSHETVKDTASAGPSSGGGEWSWSSWSDTDWVPWESKEQPEPTAKLQHQVQILMKVKEAQTQEIDRLKKLTSDQKQMCLEAEKEVEELEEALRLQQQTYSSKKNIELMEQIQELDQMLAKQSQVVLDSNVMLQAQEEQISIQQQQLEQLIVLGEQAQAVHCQQMNDMCAENVLSSVCFAYISHIHDF